MTDPVPANGLVIALADNRAELEAVIQMLLETGSDYTPVGHILSEIAPTMANSLTDLAAIVVSCGDHRNDCAPLISGARALWPTTPVVARIDEANHANLSSLIHLGVRSFVSSHDADARLISTIAAAKAQLTSLCPRLAVSLAHELGVLRLGSVGRQATGYSKMLEFSLTHRERDEVEQICRGHSNAEIANELQISESTVKSHLVRIMRKFGVRDRVGVAMFGLRNGIVTIEDLDRDRTVQIAQV